MNFSKMVLATGNLNKVKELSNSLSPLNNINNLPPIHWLSLKDIKASAVVENGASFVENALLKARQAASDSGLPALADDSGLCVQALGGAPGIYSARYAGTGATDQQNMDKLLSVLTDCANRQAYFYCALVWVATPDDPTPTIATARWHGEIAKVAKGDNGFGYDPIFYLPSLERHAAELSATEKRQLSHRAQAITILLSKLSQQIAIML